jgi:hypothetical protein
VHGIGAWYTHKIVISRIEKTICVNMNPILLPVKLDGPGEIASIRSFIVQDRNEATQNVFETIEPLANFKISHNHRSLKKKSRQWKPELDIFLSGGGRRMPLRFSYFSHSGLTNYSV